jgi:hypothetical protein
MGIGQGRNQEQMNMNKERSKGIRAVKQTITAPPQERNGRKGGMNDQWEAYIGRQGE